ncbi:hypothetical protein [Clostridium sp.]
MKEGAIKERHIWLMSDDIIAFYLYKNSTKEIDYTYDKIANRLGMSTASLKMRGANYGSLVDNETGLSDVAEQTSKVFECFKELNSKEFRELAIKLLDYY